MKDKKYIVLIKLIMKLSWIDINSFKKVTENEFLQLEKDINRKLPKDFRYFYKNIWYWSFIYWWTLDELKYIKLWISMPIYFVKWSLNKKDRWATLEEHDKYYISRWEYNPNPNKFKNEEMHYHWFNLFDLVNIWWNWWCDYLCVNTDESSDIKFCLLTSYETIEYKSKSFIKGFYFLLVDMYSLDNNFQKIFFKYVLPFFVF